MENILLVKGSRAEGKSTKQMDLAGKTGVLVIAIRRDEILLLNRLSEAPLQAGDTVYCIGAKTDLERVTEWFDPAFVGQTHENI